MRTFEGDGVSFDRLDSIVWDNGLSTLQNGCNTNFFPVYGHLNRKFNLVGGMRIGLTDLSSGVDIFDRLANFWTNSCADVSIQHAERNGYVAQTIPRNECHSIFSLKCKLWPTMTISGIQRNSRYCLFGLQKLLLGPPTQIAL